MRGRRGQSATGRVTRHSRLRERPASRRPRPCRSGREGAKGGSRGRGRGGGGGGFPVPRVGVEERAPLLCRRKATQHVAHEAAEAEGHRAEEGAPACRVRAGEPRQSLARSRSTTSSSSSSSTSSNGSSIRGGGGGRGRRLRPQHGEESACLGLVVEDDRVLQGFQQSRAIGPSFGREGSLLQSLLRSLLRRRCRCGGKGRWRRSSRRRSSTRRSRRRGRGGRRRGRGRRGRHCRCCC